MRRTITRSVAQLYCMYTQIVSQSAGNGTTGNEIKVQCSYAPSAAARTLLLQLQCGLPRSSQDEPHCHMHPNCWLHCSLWPTVTCCLNLYATSFYLPLSLANGFAAVCVGCVFIIIIIIIIKGIYIAQVRKGHKCHLAGLHLNFYSLASPRTLNTLHAWSNCHFSTPLYY